MYQSKNLSSRTCREALSCYGICFLATEDQPSENFNLAPILLFYEKYRAKYFRKVTEKKVAERMLNLKSTVYWVSEGSASLHQEMWSACREISL